MLLSSAFSPDAPLVLVGAGKMGGSLLKGWLDRGLDRTAVVVVDPAPPAESAAALATAGIAATPSPPADRTAGAVVVAVKPQQLGDVLPGLKPLIGGETVVVSIAAGASLARLAAGLGAAAIVRAMPNTPAQIGRGITAAIANDRLDAAGREKVDLLLAALGEVLWFEDEDLIDAATAVSGSGPAYVFLLAQCLAEAGAAVGLDNIAAARLARVTVAGAGALLDRTEASPEALRRSVASPGGTTEAALEVLMADDGLAKLMREAVAAAKKRARALSG